MQTTNIDDIITTGNITLREDGNLSCHFTSSSIAKMYLPLVKKNKLAIIAELQARKETAARRRAALSAMAQGINAIRDAVDANEAAYNDFSRRMDEGTSVFTRDQLVKVDEVKARYPREAAYLKAEGWRFRSNYIFAAAGKKAMHAILDGEDYNKAIAAMEAEVSNPYFDKY